MKGGVYFLGVQKPALLCQPFVPFLVTHFLPQKGLGSWVT